MNLGVTTEPVILMIFVLFRLEREIKRKEMRIV